MQKTKQKNGKKIKYSNNKYFVVSRNKIKWIMQQRKQKKCFQIWKLMALTESLYFLLPKSNMSVIWKTICSPLRGSWES